MYDTIVTEDGRLAIVCRLPTYERKDEDDPRVDDPIIIEYGEPGQEKSESGSRVIIIDIANEPAE